MSEALRNRARGTRNLQRGRTPLYIRSIDTVDGLNSVATTVKPAELQLAKQVIATFDGPVDLAD